MRNIEERTKVKDSDNQLNNSALSGAEFATFYAKLRQKRVKSPKTRKNAKTAKRAENERKGRKAANFRHQSRSRARPARKRRPRRRGRRTPEAAERTRVVWLRCAKVGECTRGALLADLPCSRCARWLPRALVRRLRIRPIVPPEWGARADFSGSRVRIGACKRC